MRVRYDVKNFLLNFYEGSREWDVELGSTNLGRGGGRLFLIQVGKVSRAVEWISIEDQGDGETSRGGGIVRERRKNGSYGS